MTDSAAGRRFLISVGVGAYKDSSIPDLPGAVRDADRVAALLVPMGYTRVLTELSRNPARNALVEGLDEWAFETRLGSEDVVVVYFAGHGQKNGPKHHLLCADHRPGLWSSTAVKSDDFAEPLVQSDVGHLLVVLDTCFASAGTESVATLAAQLTDRRRGSAQRAVLAAARGKEPAKENRFVDALARVLAKPQAGPSQRYLSVREVTARINELLDSPHQHASHSVIDSSGQDPFFDNRLYVPTASRTGGLDLGVLAQLRKRHDGHYGPRGKGLEHAGERGSYFTGRVPALSSLAGWLAGPHDRKARVITGDPGSGKSALLGRFLELTDPDHPARVTAPDSGWLPPLGLDVIRLWARRVTCADLVRDLAAAVSLPDADRDQLLKALGESTDRIVIVIDSLDEAGTAGDQSEGRRIARELLQPLSALPAVRLVVGTRRDLIPALGHAIEVIDLDTDEHAREAVTEYARAVLLDAHDPDSLSPYRDDPERARAVAAGIAARAGRSFLVARMNARALVHRQEVVDTSAEGWERTLPSDAREAFAAYLDRFGTARQRVVRLLRPLAYAQGEGLPWSTVWAPLAEALSGTPCTNDDLDWLFENAGSYITESDHGTGSVYRLYHETMAEYLRVPSRAAEHHRALATGLAGLVFSDPLTGERDWATAHPYILTHLASHAAAGGVLDRSLADAEYLVHAHPASLLRALDSAASERGRRVASVYRTSAHLLPRLAVENRRDVLSVDAARYGEQELSRRLARGRRWRARWATGGLVHPAHRRTLAMGTMVSSVCSTSINNRPHIVAADVGATVRVWDLHTGDCTLTFDDTEGVTEISGIVIDHQPYVLTGYDEDAVRLWNLRTGECALILDEANDAGTLCGMTIDGRPHALTGGRKGLRLWDLRTGECALVLDEPKGVSAVCGVTLDGRPHALTCDHDGRVRLSDLRGGGCTLTLDESSTALMARSIDIDDRPHAVTADDAAVHLWDLRTGRRVRTLVGHTDSVEAACGVVVDDRPHLLTCGADETVRLWDVRTGDCVLVLTGHTNALLAVCAATVNGRPHAVSGGYDTTLRVWDLTSRHVASPRGWHSNWITAIHSVPGNGRHHVLTSGYDNSVRLWDLGTGRCVDTFLPRDPVRSVQSAVIDGRPYAVTRDAEHTMHLWDFRTGKRTLGFTADEQLRVVGILDVNGRPHGVTSGYNLSVHLWDLTAGALVRTLPHATASTRQTAVGGVVLNDRPHALIATFDGLVEVWDFEAGEPTRVLRGHTQEVRATCSATVDNRAHALSAGDDRTARLWDLHSGRSVLCLTGHTAAISMVTSITLDDEPHALTAAYDHTVRLWNLRTGECTDTITLPLVATAATAVDNQLVLCFANDMALFER